MSDLPLASSHQERQSQSDIAITALGQVLSSAPTEQMNPNSIEFARLLGDTLARAACNICGFSEFQETLAFIDEYLAVEEKTADPNWREGIVCGHCGSNSRDRCLIMGLAAIWTGGTISPLASWESSPDVRIFDTSGYRGYPQFLGQLCDYFNTSYDPLALEQEPLDGRLYADLQKLHYPDEFFDFVLTSDVFEHVRLYKDAFQEVFRVIRQGGTLLLQVPYEHHRDQTFTRVYPSGDKDVFLYPPEYHAEDTLVYRTYGRDLLLLLSQLGFSVCYLDISMTAHAISPQSLIVAAKGPFVDVSGFL